MDIGERDRPNVRTNDDSKKVNLSYQRVLVIEIALSFKLSAKHV